ncbi:CK1 protein kinase, partial [Aphelenchoides avenae]
MSGPEPLFEVRLRANEVIAERFRVKKKLGEGSCGTVYKVEIIKRPTVPSAMKIEPFMKKKEDEILKMEHCVLRRLQTSKHVCKLYFAGKAEKFTFIVMARVGRELTELRRRQPDKRMSVVSSLRVGLQSLQAISDLHAAGFI